MQSRTRIKICGITNLRDAEDIIPLGIDALGFIFAKESPRYIEPELARDIIGLVPPFVDTVGVFMNEDPDVVNDIGQYCGLNYTQLHGSEPPEYCQAISCQVIKAFRVKDDINSDMFVPYNDVVKGFLFDTFRPGVAGGTGEVFDWQVMDDLSLTRQVILAGGLSPENIFEAVQTVNPFAVDVNSGVELEPGRKDINKITKLIEEVNRADFSINKNNEL